MPRAPKHCGHTDCHQLTTTTYCTTHQPPAWSGGHGSTRAWRTLRQQILTNHPNCADCGQPATELGHITARANNGNDNITNVKPQCRPCNLAQLATDRRRS